MTTHDDLTAKGFVRQPDGSYAKLEARNPRTVAVVERSAGDAPLEAKTVQRPVGQRIFVRVTSQRHRLLDEDNLCEKYHVDLCRYAGLLPTDAPDQVHIVVGQIKVDRKETEQTVIEIEALP